MVSQESNNPHGEGDLRRDPERKIRHPGPGLSSENATFQNNLEGALWPEFELAELAEIVLTHLYERMPGASIAFYIPQGEGEYALCSYINGGAMGKGATEETFRCLGGELGDIFEDEAEPDQIHAGCDHIVGAGLCRGDDFCAMICLRENEHPFSAAEREAFSIALALAAKQLDEGVQIHNRLAPYL